MESGSIKIPEFIYSEFIKDLTLADRIVEFFYEYPYLHREGLTGLVTPDGVRLVNKDTESLEDFDNLDYVKSLDSKRSKEILICDTLSSFPLFRELNFHIQKVLDQYLIIYPRCNVIDNFYLQPYQIQTYNPNEGFLDWHCETPCGEQPFVSRVLTFMFNCNTNDGGTEFLHQDFISTSEKGKLTIFPADWTFTHRGLPSTEEKMIVTGWWNFNRD